MSDLTDIQGRLQRLELKIEKVFGLMDELMRDQVECEKQVEKALKRLERLEKGLKPKAMESDQSS